MANIFSYNELRFRAQNGTEVLSQSSIDTNNSIAGIGKVYVEGPETGLGVIHYLMMYW